MSALYERGTGLIMLEKPALQEEKLEAYLQAVYGLPIVHIVFLPLGADVNTAVYRATITDGTSFFVKLRRGTFDATSVTLPRFFSDGGVSEIIPPLATEAGPLWGVLDPFTVIVYPFVEGRNGYEVAMSDQHWYTFGRVLRHIHTAVVPSTLLQRIPREAYAAQGREKVKRVLEQVARSVFDDPITAKLKVLLQEQQAQISDLVERAERLAARLEVRSPNFTVCHSDLHAGNILIDNDKLYIVDWDNPILAPKERDLMFIGGGQGFIGHTAQEEARLFYAGYGQTQLDPIALAYYRYERIVQDIAVYCEEIMLTSGNGQDREQALRYLTANFLPGGVLELTYSSDRTEVN